MKNLKGFFRGGVRFCGGHRSYSPGYSYSKISYGHPTYSNSYPTYSN